MTPKKSDSQKKNISRASPSPQSQLKLCKQKLNEVKKELHEKQDKILRAYADIQNLYKRMDREREQRDDEMKKTG